MDTQTKPRISIIVCSKDPARSQIHRQNIRRTIGCEYEYIRIDNSAGAFGICHAYNQGVERSQGELLVFMHEDVFLLEEGWGRVLNGKFSEDAKLGMIGVAGCQYFSADRPSWVAAGRPFIHGKVIHQMDARMILTVYSWEKSDQEAVAVDGLFSAIRRDVFNAAHFDEQTFDGFHFYDIDICMQVRKTHTIKVTPDVIVKHLSGGSYDQKWQVYSQRFVAKYRSELPVSCVQAVPDPSTHVGFESFDISRKVSSVTPV
jgi:hypothetical protein